MRALAKGVLGKHNAFKKNGWCEKNYIIFPVPTKNCKKTPSRKLQNNISTKVEKTSSPTR
jgi:hypothetical protein